MRKDGLLLIAIPVADDTHTLLLLGPMQLKYSESLLRVDGRFLHVVNVLWCSACLMWRLFSVVMATMMLVFQSFDLMYKLTMAL